VNELESRYRLLFNAYPWSYRREREDEMVATLLDAAPPDQVRPDRREAAAIVAQGLRCRLAVSTELRAGVRMGGVLALLGAVQMVGVSAFMSLHPGMSMGWRPPVTGLHAASWAVAVFGLFAGTQLRWGRWRYAFLATFAPALVLGSFLTGTTRSETLAFYGFAVVATFAAGTRVWVRFLAMAVGAGWGCAVYVRWANSWGQGFGLGWPQWLDPAIPTVQNSWFVLGICAAGVVLGLIRSRFAVMAAVVAVPVGFAQVCMSSLGDPSLFSAVSAGVLGAFWVLRGRRHPATT
jgi:hypothetical protein